MKSAHSLWKNRHSFYFCLIPIAGSFLLLYFWIVICAHFRYTRYGFKTAPMTESRFEANDDADEESGLRTRPRIDLDLYETNDRRYIYTMDTADGMSPLPAFQAYPESLPDMEPEFYPEMYPEVYPEMYPEVYPEMNPYMDLEPEPELEPEPQLEPEPELNPDPNPDKSSISSDSSSDDETESPKRY